ncbi:MAG TPA: UDP-N-acetylmuramate dehydrogenase [Candidatus Paceibacterota bacterium]
MIKRRNIKLAKYSNYKIGGPASYFLETKTIGELREAIKFARDSKMPMLILGGGTNLLISDSGFRGVVIHPVLKSIKVIKKNLIEVGSGALVKNFLRFTVLKKLSGIEWAGGLPGMVGGAVRGNAGCFGGETKDSILSVKSVRVSDGKVIVRNNKQCAFGYRDSVFKKNDGKEIIVSAIFKLTPGVAKDIKKSIQEKIDYRSRRHPMERPSIGSIFKNIPLAGLTKRQQTLYRKVVKNDPFPVVPSAYVISRAGVVGKRAGGAMISPKHPNFIVNMGGAKAKDVEKLIALVKKEVWRKFKIRIEEEIIRI